MMKMSSNLPDSASLSSPSSLIRPPSFVELDLVVGESVDRWMWH